MRSLALILSLLVGAPVLGAAPQGTTNTSRGNFLRIPRYQTTGALNLFVGPTGVDTNDCLSASTPCLTLQGAEDKIPKLVRHPVVVTIAAGNYAGVAIYGHTFDPAVPANGAYMQWTSALTTASVATGTASGTATAGSAGSATGPVFGTLTDGGNSWTVNDLRLKLLEITGGTGSGQIKAICGNTATVITICGTFSPAPDNTSTYAVRVPGAQITSSVSISAYPGIASTTGGGIYAYNNTRIRNLSTVGSLFLTNIGSTVGASFRNSSVQINNCIFSTATAAASGATVGDGATVNINGSSFAATTGSALAVSTNGITPGASWRESIFLATTGRGALIGIGSVQLNLSEFVSTGAATSVVDFGGDLGGANAINFSFSTSKVTCTNSSTIGVQLLSNSNTLQPYNNAVISSSTIAGCATAVNVPYAISINIKSTNTLTGAAAGTGVTVAKGGRVVYDGSGPTISGFTNELSVDGVIATFAAINAASPTWMTSSAGSFIGK